MESHGDIRLVRTNEWIDKITVNRDGSATFTLHDGHTYTAHITDRNGKEIAINDRAAWQDIADDLVTMLKHKGLIPADADASAFTQNIRVTDRLVRRGDRKFMHGERAHGHKETAGDYRHLSDTIDRALGVEKKRKHKSRAHRHHHHRPVHRPPVLPDDQALLQFSEAVEKMNHTLFRFGHYLDDFEQRNEDFMFRMQEVVGEQGQAYMESLHQHGEEFAHEARQFSVEQQRLAAEAQRQVSELVGVYQARLGDLHALNDKQQEVIAIQMRALQDLEGRLERLSNQPPQAQTPQELLDTLEGVREALHRLHELLDQPAAHVEQDGRIRIQEFSASAESENLQQILIYQRQVLEYASQQLDDAAKGLPISLADELGALPPFLEAESISEEVRSALEASVLPILRDANRLRNALEEAREEQEMPSSSPPSSERWLELDPENQQLRERISVLARELEPLRAKLESSEQRFAEVQSRLTEAQSRLQNREGRFERQEKRIRELEEELSNSGYDRAPEQQTQKRIHDLEAELVRLRAVDADIASFREANESLWQRLDALSREKKDLEKEMEALKDRLSHAVEFAGGYATYHDARDIREGREREELTAKLEASQSELETTRKALEAKIRRLEQEIEARDLILKQHNIIE